MMRIDYAPDFSQIKYMDLERVAKGISEDWKVNCEWIVGSPGFLGHPQTTTFEAEGYGRFPGLEDFDYLRTYTPIAHSHGIRIISYLNMHWFAYDFADLHPDWEQVTSDGERYGRHFPLYGDGTTFCVNTPWRDWAFGLIREAMKTGIDGVVLDGPRSFTDCCYCASCREQFKSLYGADIPREDWEDPLWKSFIKFREDSLSRFMKDAHAAMCSVNPKGVIFTGSGGWAPGAWRAARDIQNLEPYQNFNLAEAFFHYGAGEDLNSMLTGKYLRAGKRPAVVAAHYMNGLWHYLLLPPEELKMEFYQTLASGASPWIALINSSLESIPDGNEPAKEVFGFLDKHDEYYTNTDSMAEVGLLFSANTGRFYLSQFEGFYNVTRQAMEENLVVDTRRKTSADWSHRRMECEKLLTGAYRGYFSALTRGHILFDILLDESLTAEKLSQYKTIVLPDGACLSEDAVSVLTKFVENGGNLLASFEAGFYDEDGNSTDALWNLLGIDKAEGIFPVTVGENYQKTSVDHLGFEQGRLIERAPYALKVTAAAGTETLARFLEPVEGYYLPLKGVSIFPALVVSNHGKGKVAYFPEAIGHFCTYNMVTAEQRICRMIKEMSGESILEVAAPKTVSVDVYRQDEQHRIMIHLLNHTVDQRPVSEFLPVTNLRLTLRTEEKPKEVFALRGSEIHSTHDQNHCSIEITSLLDYEVIVIAY